MNKAEIAYRGDGHSELDGQALADLAQRYGTPLYVYSQRAIDANITAYQHALNPGQICFAVKANNNLTLLKHMARRGLGFDVVSGGELQRVRTACADGPKFIVFSGVGKSRDEIAFAIESEVDRINVESLAELERIQAVAAQLDRPAKIAMRVNPDVDPRTHRYISTGLKENKFGIASKDVLNAYRWAQHASHLQPLGVACHIGSQMLHAQPIDQACRSMLALIDQLTDQGIAVDSLDLGGGMGIQYQSTDTAWSVDEFYAGVKAQLANRPELTLIVEPGRSIIGGTGVLLTRVEYLKYGEDKQFAVVDAGMNDFMRPALYQGWHNIRNAYQDANAPSSCFDLVGPICESTDVLAKNRQLALAEGDLIIIEATGAYGMSLASNYNSRVRPAEVLITDTQHCTVIRRRETFAETIAAETDCR